MTPFKRIVAGLALGLGLAASAVAADWPQRPITLVVPFPAGGSADSLARAISPQLQSQLGQTFVIDNKPGASGTIGATAAHRAEADGYTLLVTALGPLVIAPHLLSEVRYDPQTDFEMLTVALQAPNLLVVPAQSPYQDVAGLIEAMKAKPDSVTFASSGVGSSGHLTAELFWQQSGTMGTHVPYKGDAPSLADLLGGQVDASFQNMNVALPHVLSGRLKALGISSKERSPLVPDVPTLAEVGLPDGTVYSWQAVLAPKGVPQDIQDRVQAATVQALQDPKVRAQFEAQGFEVVGNSAADAKAFQDAEFKRWGELIRSRNITAD